MRIVTWNCCRRSEATALPPVIALRPQLALIQEIRSPSEPTSRALWTGPSGKVGLRTWAEPRFDLVPAPVAPLAPWSIVPYRITRPTRLNVLHAWTRYEHGYLKGLAAAIEHYASFIREAPTVVAGDLNANAIWDSPRKPIDFSRLAGRLHADFGLVSAYHAHTGEPFGQERYPTHYFRRQRQRPFHIDYCFIPSAWSSAVVAEVPHREPWNTLSDHMPLVVDVHLDAG